MKKFLWIIMLLHLFMLSNVTSFATEALEDFPAVQIILCAKVQSLVYQEKYDELEKMAKEFRTTKAQSTGGGWKLAIFYNSIDFRSADKNDVQCNEYISKLEKWMRKYPDSLAARIMTANAWIAYGWRARGGGWANTVSEEGWRLFHERVEKAYKLLKDKPADPSGDCPGRYYLLLQVAQAQSWDKERCATLFHEAVTFEPGYYAFYMMRAFSLAQRWGGEKGEWQKFAEKAIKLTPQNEGMGIYTRILRYMWSREEFKDFKDPSISWSKMKQGFIDMERVYPNSSYNLNSFCMFACIADDKETARALFLRIGNTPKTEVWKGRANFEKWRRWAASE